MYKKISQSGAIVEVYEYEKEPPEYRPRKKSRYKNTRRRSRNVSRSHSTLFRLVQANVSRDTPVAFLTLTMREVVSLKEGWRAFNRFTHKLRRATDGKISYIAVPEFQKRGAVHFHCLVWGGESFNPCLASNVFYVDKTGKRKRKHLCNESYPCEWRTYRLKVLWGEGFVNFFQTTTTDGLAGYVAKYLSKAMHDIRYSGEKSYSASRTLLRPVHIKSKEAIYYIERELNGDSIQEDGTILEAVDNPLVPLKERTYNTLWLGKCNYKKFNFKPV